MKKTFLALFAVLLVILMANCPNPGGPDGPNDGLAHLTISTGGNINARALTNTLAQDGTNYYEVAFLDSKNTVHRTSWDKGKTGRISIPEGDYSGANKAVLFAGRNIDGDKTLLGVGTISDPADGKIDASTTQVTFTLSSLQTEISINTTSTFKIIDPTPADPYIAANQTISGKQYPVFPVPKDEIKATYTVNCGATGASNSKYAGVYINGTGTVDSTGALFFSGGGSIGTSVSATITPDTYITNPPTLPAGCVAPTGLFDIEFDTRSVSDGITQITISVPVSPINATNATNSVWYIRGGLTQDWDKNATKAQNSETFDDPGGAIIIAVGNVNFHNTIQIIPSP